MHLAAAATAAMLVSGCSVVDRFGPRVDTYNETADASKSRLLLQNIVRAAYQEPLQWSTVSQIQGTASVTATLAGKVPVIGHRVTSSLFYEIDPSAGISGGPTFTVPLLDTKEFQGGIQAQISLQTLKTYIDQGYTLDILLPLLVSSVEVGPRKGSTVTIENFDIDRTGTQRVDNKNLINLFNGGLRILIDQGLTIEEKPTPVGALILPKDLASPKTVTDAMAAGLEIRKYELPNPLTDLFLTAAERSYLATQKATIYFRTFRNGLYRFCFDSARRFHENNLEQNVLEHSDYKGKEFTLLVKAVNDTGTATSPDKRTSVRVTPKLVCGYDGPTDGNVEVLKFTMRSVEGAIRYLGALTKMEVEGDEPRWPGPDVSLTKSGKPTATLFRVYRNSAPGSSIDVSRGGQTYSISLDNYPMDLSGKVLSLLLELVNLNNSVKDQPTPNVISVIAP